KGCMGVVAACAAPTGQKNANIRRIADAALQALDYAAGGAEAMTCEKHERAQTNRGDRRPVFHEPFPADDQGKILAHPGRHRRLDLRALAWRHVLSHRVGATA